MHASFLQQIAQIPRVGFGIGLKDNYSEALLSQKDDAEWCHQVDWLEVIAENYFKPSPQSHAQLQALIEVGFPIASHGVNMSLGSKDPLSPKYLKDLEALFHRIEPVWFSDHLCFTSLGGHYANDLLPLPLSEESAEHCIKKILQIKTHFDIPFLIENVSTYIELREPEWDEATWLGYIVREADCGLLLDVNNVFVNTQNHGGNAKAFIDALPLDYVTEIHMAGHLETDGLLIDTHGEAIRPEVFELFAYTVAKCKHLKGVLLERDSQLPPLTELLEELTQLRLLQLESLSG